MRRIIALTAAGCAATAAAFADTLRCGSSLIKEGDTQGYVQEKCGEPESKQTYTEPVYARRRENGTTLRGRHHQQGCVALQTGQLGSFPAVLDVRAGRAAKARVREIGATVRM